MAKGEDQALKDGTKDGTEEGLGGVVSPGGGKGEVEARSGTDEDGGGRVPVGVALRGAARAREAEERVEALMARVAELESELERSRLAMDSVEMRSRIEREVLLAGAIDVETAVLLTEMAMEAGGVDVEGAVSELRAGKPFLFSSGAGRWSGAAMGGGPSGASPMARAAEDAATGDRAALMRYLRLRRGG